MNKKILQILYIVLDKLVKLFPAGDQFGDCLQLHI